MAIVALVGAFTALFAGTIGVAQDDIKRVLAYSTVSQLGFMVAALGIGAYVAGAFHLITHAFFKALLFMSAGSVIHGVGTNDMMQMGNVRKKMPITTTVFIIGALALAGIPPLAGFWSKDEILAHAFELGFGEHPEHGCRCVFVMLALAAFFTAFYMARQIFLTFFGPARDHHKFDHAHESPVVMWAPLAVLAFFAITIGFINARLGISFFEQFRRRRRRAGHQRAFGSDRVQSNGRRHVGGHCRRRHFARLVDLRLETGYKPVNAIR